MEDKERKSSDFLALGLYAFAGFGLEILLVLIENNFINIKLHDTAQHCLHWILTIVLWGIVSFLLINISKSKYNYNLWNMKENVDSKRWAVVIILAIVMVVITTVLWGGLKPVVEFQNNGVIKTVFQNIYYCFEALLIFLTIAFGQKWGEMLLKRNNIPWGGIFLGVTWGLMHILTQGFETGIYALVMSIVYGITYLLLKKNSIFSYIVIAIIFIL